MNGPIRRLAAGMLAAFGLLLATSTWVQVVAADTYRSDARNARTAIHLSSKERGVIVTSDGVVVARSVPGSEDPRAFTRLYPEGETFAHVVGYASRLVGSSGVEQAYTEVLRSRRDITISDMIAAVLGRDLRPLNLQLTIDSRLQRAAEEALAGQQGAIVALDPRTGAVLAYVSSPSYDPQPLLGRDALAVRQELLDDPAGPLRDRAGSELYAPGSTFKVVVSAAALESGLAGPETLFADRDAYPLEGSTATIQNFDGQPCLSGTTVTLQTAFVRSCNTVFAELATQLGADAIDQTANAFGFNRGVPFPWPLAMSMFPRNSLVSDPAALAQSGIGERDVRSTVMTMTLVAAGVANEGEVMEPQLVSQVFNSDGVTVEELEPRRMAQAVSPAAAAVLAQMMERVVTEGTGRRAAVPGIRIAGKTGTAEKPEGAPDLWFIGFAPLPEPTIALAVLIEDGGTFGEDATGGSVAAPIAARLIETWLSR